MNTNIIQTFCSLVNHSVCWEATSHDPRLLGAAAKRIASSLPLISIYIFIDLWPCFGVICQSVLTLKSTVGSS